MSATIFRDYDREGLEAQFTLDGVANLDQLMARRLRAAAVAREEFACELKVPYGDRPAATVDIFPARGAPILVFIHGGFWRSLDAATFSFLARGFVPFGVSLVVIDYPLIPDVALADIVDSCRRAVGWVRRNARRCGGDPERLYISGNSAGGHLVAMLMGRPMAHGLPTDVVKGGCAISGLYDLEPVRLSRQNETLHFTAEEAADLSPIHHVPGAAGPLILSVGGAETREFLLQTEDYSEAWRNAGHNCQTIVVPGKNHIDVLLDGLAEPTSALNQAVREMIETAQ